MIGEIMLGPLVSAWAVPAVVMALILTAALAAVGAGRLSLLVFGIVIAVSAAESAVSATSIGVVSVGLRTMILCYVKLRIIWRVLTDPTVTQDTVSAVACGYVLLGLIWGGFYALLEAERPGSFAIPAGWMRTNGGQARALMYFSLVTLSSLGQGDVLPAGPTGRTARRWAHRRRGDRRAALHGDHDRADGWHPGVSARCIARRSEARRYWSGESPVQRRNARVKCAWSE